jgi:hypothetical protein
MSPLEKQNWAAENSGPELRFVALVFEKPRGAAVATQGDHPDRTGKKRASN